MIVKVKPQGDGTIFFDVICRRADGRRIVHSERLYIPPKSDQHKAVLAGKGCRALVLFDRTGRDRNRATLVGLL
jgi:hypothetical protein